MFEWGEFLRGGVFQSRLCRKRPEFGPDATFGLLLQPNALSTAVEAPVKMQFFNRHGDYGRGDLFGGVFCQRDALR